MDYITVWDFITNYINDDQAIVVTGFNEYMENVFTYDSKEEQSLYCCDKQLEEKASKLYLSGIRVNMESGALNIIGLTYRYAR